MDRLAILAASLMLTLFAWHLSRQYLAQRVQDRFEFRTGQITAEIEKKLLEFEQVLRSAAGFFETSHEVSRDEWHRYVRTSALLSRHSGDGGRDSGCAR